MLSRAVCSGHALSSLSVWVDLGACKEALLHLLGLLAGVGLLCAYVHPL